MNSSLLLFFLFPPPPPPPPPPLPSLLFIPLSLSLSFPPRLAAFLSFCSLYLRMVFWFPDNWSPRWTLCKVLPPWPLLFQQKKCYASCIWTSSGIQYAGSLIAHFQLPLPVLTPISWLLWDTGSLFSVVRIDLLAMDHDNVGQISTPSLMHDEMNAMDERSRSWNAKEYHKDHDWIFLLNHLLSLLLFLLWLGPIQFNDPFQNNYAPAAAPVYNHLSAHLAQAVAQLPPLQRINRGRRERGRGHITHQYLPVHLAQTAAQLPPLQPVNRGRGHNQNINWASVQFQPAVPPASYILIWFYTLYLHILYAIPQPFHMPHQMPNDFAPAPPVSIYF
jgi:hypothetical protein